MMPFQYKRISKSFIEELSDRVQIGESAVLLGPRYGGKRHVMFRVRSLLKTTESNPIVQIRFLAESPVATAQQAMSLISAAVTNAGFNLQRSEDSGENLFQSIDELYDQTKCPIVLFAANIDSLAHHLARRFLQGIRKRVESGEIVAILSGEDDLRDLVYGPNSEFACANQFVLQGYSKDEFDDYLNRYVRQLHLTFDSFPEASARIWTITGGNTYTIRLVLWDLIETRARSDASPNEIIPYENIRTSLNMVGIPGVYGSHVFRHATELIARDSECWRDLELLIAGEPAFIGIKDYSPSLLELAGVAFREIRPEGGELRFTSPLMEQFVTRYYDDRRFGDLYAAMGRWDEAFERYSRLEPEATMRPSGANDRGEVEATINALCASLYSEATKDISAVKELFERGCHCVLGFPEVSFWHYNTWERSRGWELQDSDNAAFTVDTADKIASLLGVGGKLSPGLLPLSESLDKYCVAAILPALRSDQQVAVVVSDLERRAVISRERDRLLKQLLHHFVESYSHAVLVDGLQVRLRVRDKHMEVMNSILDSWGSSFLDVHHVLKMAARGLRTLQYSRVLFCLVDPGRQRIRGIIDDSDDANVDVAEMTSWPLDKPTADLQPYVVFTRQPKIVPDAALEPLANQAVVRQARMKAEAIIPILNSTGEAIGTIHVERADGLVPSWGEAKDLLAFGRQLAVAIEQSERVNLLESALDEIPEPIVIVDGSEHPRYSNHLGAELFDIPEGWLSRNSTVSLSETVDAPILEPVRQSLNSGQRSVRHLLGIGTDPSYRGAALTSPIHLRTGPTKSEQVIGGLVHIQDLNYLYRVIEAFRVIAEASDTPSAISSVLEAAKLLGPKWGRLYLVDQNRPDYFVSKLSFGFANAAEKAEFNRGAVVLPSRKEPGHEHWLSIDRNQPIVFCWKPAIPINSEVRTPYGLTALNVNPEKSPIPVRKKEGQFWIDFPLSTGDKVLGKVCLHCDENLRPEDFELLKVLSEMAAGLLDAALRRDSAFLKANARMAHNLHTRLGALAWILLDYKQQESKLGALKEINERFARVIAQTTQTTQRAKQLLGPIVPTISKWDVGCLIKQTLDGVLPKGAWQVESKTGVFSDLDAQIFEAALLELVENSREMIASAEELVISILLERYQLGSRDWIRVVYSDNGPGIPLDLHERIFEDFFSQRPKNKDAGLGIGLSYVRRVIESHGGQIKTEPSTDGARFVISIPASSLSEV